MSAKRGSEERVSEPKLLFDFSQPGETARWHAVDDRVMGGVSASRILRLDDSIAAFCGEVSLDNNGGFASVHAAVPKGILGACESISVYCRGDGHQYSLRLRQDEEYDGISWRCDFAPSAGEWLTVTLPLSKFRPVFRGRELTTTGPLDPTQVRRVGLLIAERQAGPFKLELESISAR